MTLGDAIEVTDFFAAVLFVTSSVFVARGDAPLAPDHTPRRQNSSETLTLLSCK